ncbi:mannosyltransferase [Bradyrhizobium sp. NAS80.1]|uniref:glycosyltransferase n=1 Tax=Bradyrhizobium sp. NAS80.1 TaxID=1680159 RepID=UPI0009659771|nr:glycosyltransferase [Bradyrhizobium sp. NAS80.1]OKO77041.1 mannosyltransferase [Bradyrhizobium sp. NAS80.1]
MKRYHVGIFLELPLDVGGGFQQSLTDILWMRDWAKTADLDVTVFTTLPDNVAILADLGINSVYLKLGWLDRLFLFLKYLGPFDLLQYAMRVCAPFEKKLSSAGVDIVYFTTTSNWNLALYKLPFIITIFDGCFRDSPEFDEVREFAQFERRDIVWRSAVTKAAVVITNADELIDMLCRRYAMERDHAVCIPFSPSLYVSRSGTTGEADDAAILKKYGLEPGYLFYPAQFWSHKNHATILLAMRLLRDQGERHTLVLCGSDPGARAAFEALVAQHGLGDSVRMLGFVPSVELGALYRGANALVMATYFGPTNLPPLEAWAVGTAVIYPEAFKAQAGDAAILFDYDDPASLAKAIVKVGSAEERARLAIAGKERLAYFAGRIDEGHQQLARHLIRLRYRRYPQIY